MILATQILKQTLRKWQLLKTAEVFVLSIGITILTFLLSANLWLSFVLFLVSVVLLALWVKPWKYSLETVCKYLDRSIPELEDSASLLLAPSSELSLLGRIQQSIIAEKITSHKRDIKFKNQLGRNALIALFCLLLGVGIRYSGVLQSSWSISEIPLEEAIHFQALDSAEQKISPPVITNQKVTIKYPKYTKKAATTTSKMNLKILEGAKVTWNIGFDTIITKATMQFGSTELDMLFKNDTYWKSIVVDSSSIYNLKFYDLASNSYLSDLYALELVKDEVPVIEVKGLPQFSSFDFDEEHRVAFTTKINDDFGIAEAYIIATVSKGSGESVKFREEKLSFDTDIQPNAREMVLQKSLDLQQLKMELGDELYFYIETKDFKQPRPNISRTETYFAVIKDTVSGGFAVEGTLGADLMPDYFRSQRQLIIDTEKLIASRKKIAKSEFNTISNELGFDQKALRLKYGKFMGDETEGSFSSDTDQVTDTNTGTEDENTLAEYTHDHDGANEHNLVDHDHDHDHEEAHDKKGTQETEDPLEAYLHNHGDPESATLFTQSLRSKLKQAMTEMWDAELYLRLFEPEKSLPYQYKALKLIQEIKNSARIYVHRIGFDPPPIKEEKRLTGKIDEISNVIKKQDIALDEVNPYIKETIGRIEMILTDNQKAGSSDRELFEKAGNELAVLAIEMPVKYLKTLQDLKWLSQAKSPSREQWYAAQQGLLDAIPENEASPTIQRGFHREINSYVLEALDAND